MEPRECLVEGLSHDRGHVAPLSRELGAERDQLALRHVVGGDAPHRIARVGEQRRVQLLARLERGRRRLAQGGEQRQPHGRRDQVLEDLARGRPALGVRARDRRVDAAQIAAGMQHAEPAERSLDRVHALLDQQVVQEPTARRRHVAVELGGEPIREPAVASRVLDRAPRRTSGSRPSRSAGPGRSTACGRARAGS